MTVQGFDHYIQREIFLKLRQHDVARYSELNIKSIESSQFMYHLKELIRAGLVEKIGKGQYRLTAKGITYSQNFSTEQKNITISPLTYSLIFARSNKGNWLILKRNKQPYINLLGCLSGKVHMEETLTDAAKREWDTSYNSKTNPEMIYKGMVSVLLRDNERVLTHITGPVWFIDNLNEDWQEYEAPNGTLLWADWTKIPYDQFIPGWKEIIEAIEISKQPFLLDLSFTL